MSHQKHNKLIFFLFIFLRSANVTIEISVAKLSPVTTFSIEFVSLSTSKSSPISFRLFTLRIYGKIVCLASWFAVNRVSVGMTANVEHLRRMGF